MALPSFWRARPLASALGAAAALFCAAAILLPVIQVARWSVHTHQPAASGGGSPGMTEWVRLRGQVPASITVFVPTWLPADLQDISPSWTTGGGGRAWTYSVSYTDDRLRGDRPYLVFAEEVSTPLCPHPSCLQSTADSRQPLPWAIRQRLPHAIFLAAHDGSLDYSLHWQIGPYVYSPVAHGESRQAVVRVAASLRRF